MTVTNFCICGVEVMIRKFFAEMFLSSEEAFIMKKFFVAVLLAAVTAAAFPQAESAMPVGRYKCMNCGVVVETKYDVNTNKIPAPDKHGCKKSPNGEHNWRALGVKMR